MINLRNRKLISFKFHSTSSTPILPPSIISGKSLTGIIRINQFKGNKRRNKKQDGIGGNGNGGFSSSLLPPLKSNWKSGPPATDEYVNLFSIYGNILAKEPELLFRYKQSSGNEVEFINYPIDPSLLKLLESSVKFWYENAGKSSLKTSISLLSLKAPSRATTWELAKHLAFKSGKSHLAIIPFPMFYELIQTCYNKMNNSIQEAQVLGNLILSKLTGPDNNINNNKNFESDLLKNNSVERTASASTSPVNSRCVIQVCEYLFACMEASLGGNSAKQEKFTLLLDGVEEYIRTRKGGEAVMKDLISWVNLFESTGRNVILGLRMSDSITRNSDEINQDENDESTTEDDSEETGNFNNSSSLVSSKEKKPSKKESSASAFQMMTSLLLNAAAGNGMNSNESITPVTNVFISGSMMRLYLTPPKNDKRKQLKYNQIIALDRKKDRFDSNMNQLKLIAQQKWNVKLDLKLKSKYDFPSEHSEIWDKLSSAGRGLLTRENLIKDEFMEIIMSIMGESKPLNAENLSEAIDRISRIRHDPSQMSSEDLNSFLSERQVSMNSLTKYEKRFINCISTSTTQTHYKDITLPVETMGTLKSLTTLPLTHPELFTQGILKNSLTGVLLFGPPGTGKTMLARAVAQESGATFLAVNMSNIFDMYVGEGEKNVKVRNGGFIVQTAHDTFNVGNVQFGKEIESNYNFY